MQLHESVRGRPLPEVLREAGIVGCGGSGFPTYAKYIELLPLHVTNAQESEPGYYIDKHLHRAEAAAFAELYAWLLEQGVKKVIVGAKQKDRDWLRPLEGATGGAVVDCTGKNRCDPHAHEANVLFAYTDDRYAFGKEGALLMIVAGTKVAAGERPTQKGVIVNNTQTLLNMHRALTRGEPVTRKLVHVYGETKHAFLDAPVGTTADDLLRAAGSSVDEVRERGWAVLEGGPGWFERIDDIAGWSLTRKANSLLLVDPSYADPSAKDVLSKPNQPGYPRDDEETHERSPRPPLEPSLVRVPLVDNPVFAKPAVPCVSVGERVTRGQVIARPRSQELSVCCHAPFEGEVAEVTAADVLIRR